MLGLGSVLLTGSTILGLTTNQIIKINENKILNTDKGHEFRSLKDIQNYANEIVKNKNYYKTFHNSTINIETKYLSEMNNLASQKYYKNINSFINIKNTLKNKETKNIKTTKNS